MTHYVTPSLVWPADEDEKESIRGAYKNKLASIDCRNFDFGAGTCPFSTSCMYRHAYRNGQLEVQSLSRLYASRTPYLQYGAYLPMGPNHEATQSEAADVWSLLVSGYCRDLTAFCC